MSVYARGSGSPGLSILIYLSRVDLDKKLPTPLVVFTLPFKLKHQASKILLNCLKLLPRMASSDKAWEDHKEIIRHLYLGGLDNVSKGIGSSRGASIKDIAEFMKKEHSFTAS